MKDGSAGFFLVEQRLPGATEAELTLLKAALSSACLRLTERGHAVSYRGSTYLPSSSRLLSLFEAASADAVRRVADSSQAPVARLEVAIQLAHTDKED